MAQLGTQSASPGASWTVLDYSQVSCLILSSPTQWQYLHSPESLFERHAEKLVGQPSKNPLSSKPG